MDWEGGNFYIGLSRKSLLCNEEAPNVIHLFSFRQKYKIAFISEHCLAWFSERFSWHGFPTADNWFTVFGTYHSKKLVLKNVSFDCDTFCSNSTFVDFTVTEESDNDFIFG